MLFAKVKLFEIKRSKLENKGFLKVLSYSFFQNIAVVAHQEYLRHDCCEEAEKSDEN